MQYIEHCMHVHNIRSPIMSCDLRACSFKSDQSLISQINRQKDKFIASES